MEVVSKCTLPHTAWEDHWFADCFDALAQSDGFVVKLAQQEVAKRFSVETIYFPTPLGMHKPWGHLPAEDVLFHFPQFQKMNSETDHYAEKVQKLAEYCPELKLVAPSST